MKMKSILTMSLMLVIFVTLAIPTMCDENVSKHNEDETQSLRKANKLTATQEMILNYENPSKNQFIVKNGFANAEKISDVENKINSVALNQENGLKSRFQEVKDKLIGDSNSLTDMKNELLEKLDPSSEKIQQTLTGQQNSILKKLKILKENIFGFLPGMLDNNSIDSINKARVSDETHAALDELFSKMQINNDDVLRVEMTLKEMLPEKAENAKNKNGSLNGSLLEQGNVTSMLSKSISTMYDDTVSKLGSLKESASSELQNFDDKITGNDRLKKLLHVEPSLLEIIQKKLTGHPTDAEQLQEALKNLLDDISGPDAVTKISAYLNTLKDQAGTLDERIRYHMSEVADKPGELSAFAKPTFSQYIRMKILGHSTLTEQLENSIHDAKTKPFGNLHDRQSLLDKVSSAASELKTYTKNTLGHHDNNFEKTPSLLDKINSVFGGKLETANEDIHAVIENAKK